MLAILDCLSPLGYDFKTAERPVKKAQRDAPARNRMWTEEVEEEEERVGEEKVTFSEEAAATEESVDNYPFFQDKNEKFYSVPVNIIPSCAQEITNVSIFSGGSSIDIYSDVSEATVSSTAYAIGKVLDETLDVAEKASSYEEALSNSVAISSPTKSLLMSNDIMDMITIMCSDTPEMCCPVSFLSKVVINFMNVITKQK